MSEENKTIENTAESAEDNNKFVNAEKTDNDQADIIVDDLKKCQDVVKKLRLHCNEYNVLGIGCDLVKYSRQKISLLLLASHRGLCALIRLHVLKKIPKELQEILEDENIIKVGVGISDIAIKLTDFHVRIESILDLRYLAQKHNYRSYEFVQLGHLSKEYLNIKLGEAGRLKNSLWKKRTNDLNKQNIAYAAKTARVAIGLFKKFEALDIPSSNAGAPKFIEEHCKNYFNKIYRYQKKDLDENQATETVDQQKVPESELLHNQEVHLISNAKECQAIIKQLREHCNKYKVLGFSCRCSTSSKTVSLLQLASHRGLCALIQLRKFEKFPTELQEILEDKNIIKVGVNVLFNVDRLIGDYGIHTKNAVDLKYLVKRCNYPPESLIRMSKRHLNIDLQNLDWRLIHTELKSQKISQQEINYVANIVHVTIELFKLFEKKLVAEEYSGDQKKFLNELCLDNDIKNGTLPDQEIHIVSEVEDYEAIAEKLRLHCSEYNVLGFDCESKSPGGRKVALLQLATHRGLCVLIQIWKLKTIPTELRSILEDANILKVGIRPQSDAKKLHQDYRLKVDGTFDLKSLARKCKYRSEGIGSLSEEVLNVKLSQKIKGLNTQKLHKKWQNDTLDKENIKYAADDAHVAIELFKTFQEKLMPTKPSEELTKNVQQFINECVLKKGTSHLKMRKIVLSHVSSDFDVLGYIGNELPAADKNLYEVKPLTNKDTNVDAVSFQSFILSCTESLYNGFSSSAFWPDGIVVEEHKKPPQRRNRFSKHKRAVRI